LLTDEPSSNWFGGACVIGPKAGAHEILSRLGCTEQLGKAEPAVALGMSPVVFGAGLVMVTVDMPLSFAGDLLTLPVAMAREREAPWETWWGKQVEKSWAEGLNISAPPADPEVPNGAK
jgi:hypothetical protein